MKVMCRARSWTAAVASSCLCMLLATCWIAPEAAMAAAKLRVGPVIVDVTATAGETVTQEVQVTAAGDEGISVEYQHVDFGFDSENYNLRLIRDTEEETTAFSTRNWFSIPRKRYVIKAGQSVQVPVRIAVPSNTPGGTYLGGAFFRNVPGPAAAGSQVQTISETGTLYFIKVAGGEPPKPVIDSVNLPKRTAQGPLRPRVVVKNEGDDFFTFSGTMTLSGPGKDDEVKLKPQYVVPGEPRLVHVAPAGKLPSLGDRDLAFGKYTVRTRLRIEPTGDTLVVSRTVWVIPTWVWWAGAAALVLLAGCIALLARRFVRRRRAAALVTAPVATTAARRVTDDEDSDDEVSDDEDELVDDFVDEVSNEPDPLGVLIDDDEDADSDEWVRPT